MCTFRKKKICLYSTYSRFLVINVCNQGKTLCSLCICVSSSRIPQPLQTHACLLSTLPSLLLSLTSNRWVHKTREWPSLYSIMARFIFCIPQKLIISASIYISSKATKIFLLRTTNFVGYTLSQKFEKFLEIRQDLEQGIEV